MFRSFSHFKEFHPARTGETVANDRLMTIGLLAVQLGVDQEMAKLILETKDLRKKN